MNEHDAEGQVYARRFGATQGNGATVTADSDTRYPWAIRNAWFVGSCHPSKRHTASE